MLIRLLLIAVVSFGIGIGVWATARYVSLPVVTAVDSDGHGPDRDTSEWRNAIERQTKMRERRAVILGWLVGLIALTGLLGAAFR